MSEDRWAGTSWRIVAVDEQAIVGEATLVFDDAGRVAGKSVINRYFGSYRAEGDTLTFGPLGSTMMAGPPEAMAEEQLVLRGLEGVEGADPEPSEDGTLSLRGTTAVRLAPAVPPGAAGSPAPLV